MYIPRYWQVKRFAFPNISLNDDTPLLGHWAEKLGEILSSINTQELITTEVVVNNIIAVFHGHIVRVSPLYL